MAAITAGGLLLFVALVLFATGAAFYNARVTPALPWFPLLVLPALAWLVVWLQRRVGVGLAAPVDIRWAPLTAFAIASMLASHCVLVLEAAAHGKTLTFEAAPAGVTPFFAGVYWASIVLAMSTASELAFRGVMQTRLTPLLGVWGGLLVPLLVNLVSHRWDGLYERLIGVTCVLLAWGWLRHMGGSLVPTLLTHILAITVWDALLWRFGPWNPATLDTAGLAQVAGTGLVALAAALVSARDATRTAAGIGARG